MLEQFQRRINLLTQPSNSKFVFLLYQLEYDSCQVVFKMENSFCLLLSLEKEKGSFKNSTKVCELGVWMNVGSGHLGKAIQMKNWLRSSLSPTKYHLQFA